MRLRKKEIVEEEGEMEGAEDEEELPVCLPVFMKLLLFLYNWSP